MPRAQISDPILVDDESGLARMLTSLSGSTAVAVDCEMDSFYAYEGRICLIQVGDGDTEWIVDPLAVDPSPMGDLLADPQIRILFHDAEYDIGRLRADFDMIVRGLFDTRAACAVVGVQQPGLASLLDSRFGVKVAKKKFQRADWRKRPLPQDQLAYAQLDVAFLHLLAEELEEELDKMGRRHVLNTEHERLEALPAAEPPEGADAWVRVKGAQKLDPPAKRRLKELYALRDEVAREAERAPFRILGDRALLSMAERPPHNTKEITGHDGINWRVARRLGDPILEVLEACETLEPIPRLPRRDTGPTLDDQARDRYDALRSWRAATSRKENMDSSLILRRELMETLALENPSTEQDLAPHLAPWQTEAYAEAILKALAKVG